MGPSRTRSAEFSASSPTTASAEGQPSDSGPAADHEPRLRRYGVHALVAVSYLVLAVAVYWPYSPFANHRIIDCFCNDPVQEVWFLHWTAWAPLHGHNPFFTHYLHAPDGANLALNTSFPLLGAIGAPITWIAGPLVTYNVLLRLALAASAFAMYAVLRRYTAWRVAAYAGGLLYGFSPYMIGHAHRHLFLTFVPLLPLFIPVVDDWLVRMRRGPVASGVLLGLLVAGEFLISPEVALMIVVAVGIGLAVLAAVHRHAVRERLAALAKGCATALLVTAVIAGYPAYLLLFGPQRPVGAIHNLAGLYKFQGDLAAPVIPTFGEYFAPRRSGLDLVNRSIQENGYYLGIPLLLLLVVAVWRFRRVTLVYLATIMGLVAFVFSLGETLKINGNEVFGHLPFTLLAKVPVVQNIEPARLSLFLQMAAAVVLAVALDRWRRDGWRRPREAAAPRPGLRRPALLTIVALAVLLPLTPRLPLRTKPARVPAFFTTSQVHVIPDGALALTYPYSMSPSDAPMMWQSASGMRFRMFGGMVFVPGVDGKSTWRPLPPGPPDLRRLLLADRAKTPVQPTPAMVPDLRALLVRYGVRVVLVDPRWKRSAVMVRVVTQALGATPRRIGGMDVWLGVPSLVRAAEGR